MRDALRTEEGTLQYELRGVPEEQGRPALRLKVDGALQLVCQRCLGALEFPLHIEVSLLLAATQAEVDAEPLEAEGPEQHRRRAGNAGARLVEDEVLLAIPIAPRHERCAGRQRRQRQARRQSPFAGLRGLMGGTKH